VTQHPTSGDLILRYYGELSADDARTLDGHLGECLPCRRAWSELSDVMAMVSRATPEEPDPDFEQAIWTRVQRGLPTRRAWTVRQLAPLAAWAALVVAIAGVQALNVARPVPPAALLDATTIAPAEAAVAAHRRVLFAALDDHLAQTEILLVEVMNAPAGGTFEFGFERDTAAELLASGRLYRNTAWQTGDLHVVAVLDDLESVLVDVVGTPTELKPEDVDLLRAQIDANDLLFKVRAVTTEIRGHQPQREAESE
jgi:hypothetical protein